MSRDQLWRVAAALTHLGREVFNPFELLYLAIAWATFKHTVWGSAFLFEGSASAADGDHLSGYLIAISVDLGMLLTSRFLQKASGWGQSAVLTLSFIIAAVVSFYFQMTYIVWHTPVFEMSKGVDPYWVTALKPFLDARVILLPLALPVLATVYTAARIFNRHKADAAQILRPAIGRGLRDLSKLIQLAERTPEVVGPAMAVAKLPEAAMDLMALTFYYKITGKSYGPYKSRNTMILAMKRVRDLNEMGQALTIEQPDPSHELTAGDD